MHSTAAASNDAVEHQTASNIIPAAPNAGERISISEVQPKGPVKLHRRTSVIYNQLEGLLKTITSADAVNPLPVRDRYIRMRKYKQCFLGRDLIKSLVSQGQAADKQEAIQIAAELLASKLIFPTTKESLNIGEGGKVKFSKKIYYSISEEIVIVANRTQRTLSRVKLQLRNLEGLLMDVKNDASEGDASMEAYMRAITLYLKDSNKQSNFMIAVTFGGIIISVLPIWSGSTDSVSSLKSLQIILFALLLCIAAKMNHSAQRRSLSILSEALGVGAPKKIVAVRKPEYLSVSNASADEANEEDSDTVKSLKVTERLAHRMSIHVDSTSGPPIFRQFAGDIEEEGNCWSEPPGELFKVRGENYLKDGLKISSKPCAFKLMCVEFFGVEEGTTVEHISRRPDTFAWRLRKEHRDAGLDIPFLFVVMFNFPGYAFACYFQRRPDEQPDPAFDGLFEQFRNKGDEFRNDRFKILPGIPPGYGNFMVRKTVGNKPAICGRAVDQVWHNTEHYLEVNLDVSNSYMATKILGMVKGFAKRLIIDLTFIIEGRDILELPERIVCGIRLHKPDLKSIPQWAEANTPYQSDGEGL